MRHVDFWFNKRKAKSVRNAEKIAPPLVVMNKMITPNTNPIFNGFALQLRRL
jgi:hypothetical protein